MPIPSQQCLSTGLLTLVEGVGSKMDPPRYLVPGNKMEVSISKIGTLRNGVKFA